MLKKVLIGVGILAALVVAGFALVVMSASSRMEEAFKTKEPEFRQYVTMSVPEQNAYVEKNMRDVLSAFGAKFDDAEFNDFVSKLENDPEAKTAGIELGRSIIADYILEAKSMADVINDENRAWLKADADASEARSNRYAEILDKLDQNKK